MQTNPLLTQKLNQWVLFLIPLAFMMVTPWPVSELSLWIAYGEHLWNDWHFLYQDSVSFLPTDNNTTSAWLISLLYYGLYYWGGLFTVAHFHHLALMVILAFIYRKTLFRNPWPWPWRERASIYALWLGTAAAFSLRPALFAFGPFLLSFHLLEQKTRSQHPLEKKDWLYLILLQILWVNLHGSFILLPIMAGWVLATQRPFWSKQWLGFLALIVSICANPFGFSIFEYVPKTKELSQFLGITEWTSAFSLTYPFQVLSYWGLLGGIVMFLFKNFKKNPQVLSSPLIPLVILPLVGLRLSVFAFCALPLFLLNQGSLFKTRQPRQIKMQIDRSPLGAIVAFALIAAFGLVGSPYLKDRFHDLFPAHLQPSFDSASIFKIAERLRPLSPSCPILNDFNVGGILMLITPHPLFMDGRVTPFTKEGLQRYLSFMKGQNVGNLIQETKPCFAVLSQSTSKALVEELLTKYDFRVLDTENEYVLLEKREAN